ncbi:hypothetical protein [Belnapia mucosa]|nr:hypothetical protein [Belnapia mucosa]
MIEDMVMLAFLFRTAFNVGLIEAVYILPPLAALLIFDEGLQI